jgi:hypothetical protein
MNKKEYTIATEIEKLIAEYEKDTVVLISDFKWKLRNIISDYE